MNGKCELCGSNPCQCPDRFNVERVDPVEEPVNTQGNEVTLQDAEDAGEDIEHLGREHTGRLKRDHDLPDLQVTPLPELGRLHSYYDEVRDRIGEVCGLE